MKKIFLLLMIAIAVISCDDGNGNNNPAEQPKNQSQTITFGADLSTTVTGNMTDTQWEDVIGKLTTALNEAVNDDGDLSGYCTVLFGVAGVNIDLIKTQEYNYYKTDLDALKIFLNADYVIEATQDDLSAKVATAINAPYEHTSDPNVPLQQ